MRPDDVAVAVDDFPRTLAQVARALLDEPDVEQTLQGIVDLAAQHLDGPVWASVSLVRERRRVDTPASSDERAARADHLQYELGQGPCLDAIWEHETFAIRDFATDQQYPQWSRRALEDTGIRSSLSFQLFTTGDTLGALNLYAGDADAFSDHDLAEGSAFAAQAAVALQTAQRQERMLSALGSRTVIGQAQGILMERYKIDGDRAFTILRLASQRTNVRLRDVAQRLVDTGVAPDDPTT